MKRAAVFALVFCISLVGLFLVLTPLNRSRADSNAYIFLAPSSGNFAINGTFNVTIAVNTGGKPINAFHIKLLFPPDKLQVASSGIGQSIVGFWVSRPSFSNTDGVIDLQGAIPSPGINTDYGIIATMTFRAKSLGQATLKFDGTSDLYLNDGKGTAANADFRGGIYNLTLPPPAGPLVVSSTHPDQDRWYNANDVILAWAADTQVEGYSYILNDKPVDLPDNVIDSVKPGVSYRALGDGIHYFHIKALRDGAWGGVTHFGVKIQTGGPAQFKLDFTPGKHTSSKEIVVSFLTSDNLSGLDRYEMGLIPLRFSSIKATGDSLFFEVTSPHIIKFDDYGSWDVIVRAYNKAGNYTEAKERVDVVKPFFTLVTDNGVSIAGSAPIPWYVFWPIVAVIAILLLWTARHVLLWHVQIELRHREGALKEHPISEKLEELKNRFSSMNLTRILAPMLISAGMLGIVFRALPLKVLAKASALSNQPVVAIAAQQELLSPPTVNLISKNINNNELFYVGGKAASGNNGVVVIYLQSLTNDTTFGFETGVEANGDWFYSHNKFLPSGEYLIWTQLKLGDNVSPPSSQMQMTVSPVAVQLGASRLSYAVINLILLIIAALIIVALSVFIIHHFRHGHRKKRLLMKEIKEAEESIRRGFAVLRRDVQAELATLKRAKLSKELSLEEEIREKQLLNDLDEINKNIGKEVWDIERRTGLFPE